MAFLSIPTDSPAGSFAVFIDAPGAFGIEPVNAIDAEHAVEIASTLHPGSRLAAVPSYALEGCNKHKVLAAWMDRLGADGWLSAHPLPRCKLGGVIFVEISKGQPGPNMLESLNTDK